MAPKPKPVPRGGNKPPSLQGKEMLLASIGNDTLPTPPASPFGNPLAEAKSFADGGGGASSPLRSQDSLDADAMMDEYNKVRVSVNTLSRGHAAALH
jgi:hypothetical protein